MSKILFWVGVILLLLLVSRLLAQHKARQRQQRSRPARQRGGPASPQAMVRCAHCGVHLPVAEAVRVHGQTFCSNDHARLGSS